MFNNNISTVVFKGQLITKLGSFLLSTPGVRKGNTLSQRMRLLTHLLICLRQRHNLDLSLAEYMDLQYFDNIVDDMKQLGG